MRLLAYIAIGAVLLAVFYLVVIPWLAGRKRR